MKVEVKKSALYMLAIALVSIFALFFLHTVSSPKEAPILHRVKELWHMSAFRNCSKMPL